MQQLRRSQSGRRPRSDHAGLPPLGAGGGAGARQLAQQLTARGPAKGWACRSSQARRCPSADHASLRRGEDARQLAQQLMAWHMANLEFANAAEVHTLSLSQWDQDDAHELLGAHCFLPGES